MFLNFINRIYIKIFIIFILCIAYYSCKTVSNNSENKYIPVDVYVCDRAGYWKNGDRVEFPFDKIDLEISSFLVSGKDIYAGGSLVASHAGAGYAKACILKNGKRIPISYLCDHKDSHINSMAIYGNDIYASGYSKTCSGLMKSGYWKNGKWIEFKKKYSTISSIIVYEGDIYTGVSRYNIDEISSADFWKSDEWTWLSYPDDSVARSGIAEIVIHNGDIYAAGSCYYGSKIRIPGYWKNGKWVKLDNHGKFVTSLFIDGEDIYISGISGDSFKQWRAGYWKNGKWIELKTTNPERDSAVSSIVVHNKNIYTAGWYENNTGYKIPCYWKNGELVTLFYEAGGLRGRNPDVISIIVVDKEQD